MSPAPACAAMPSSRSVAPESADTTTTGPRQSRPSGWTATWRPAPTLPRGRSAADVPPNFMTIMKKPESSQHALGLHQLGIEDRRAGGTADRVVSERDELVREHRTGTDASDGDRHAIAKIRVEARLRSGVF